MTIAFHVAGDHPEAEPAALGHDLLSPVPRQGNDDPIADDPDIGMPRDDPLEYPWG